MSDLSNYRRSYEKNELTEQNLPRNPLVLFEQWFAEAEVAVHKHEVNTMTIATIGLDGFPKARVVLLKSYTEDGFTFFTNYESEKGKAIAANPNVCLSFFWPELERQVIVKGIAEKVLADVSDNYFNVRPEGSRLGAIVSPQSNVIPSRTFLEEKLLQLEANLNGNEIARPDYWGGYLVRPVTVEFWQGRANRLHDRIRFSGGNIAVWTVERLAP
jgi:pyridoxamine 5'-phosphate oxidase